jgi:hypothetical protein
MKLYQQPADDLALLIRQVAFIGAHKKALAAIVRPRR